MFILVVIDYGETCDWHSRIVGTFKTKSEAEIALDKDMRSLHDSYVKRGHDVELYPSTHELWVDGQVGDIGCVWDIHHI